MLTSAPPSWPAARLDEVLAARRAQHHAALGLYLPVGFPTRTTSLDSLHEVAQSSDVVELGVPCASPHLDGPVITEAMAQALDGGFRMRDLFTAAAALTASSSAALVVMTYWAPVEQYGVRSFADQAAAVGCAGVLIPDLPADAIEVWQRAAQASGLHTIPLAPAHASAARLSEIGAHSSGMVYAPATPGRTGGQAALSPYLPRLVNRLRTVTGLPVAVGIGISTPDHAAQASVHADAVVVGSALIRRMQAQARTPAAAARAAAHDFAASVRSARRPAA